jgi:hypothetical protein
VNKHLILSPKPLPIPLDSLIIQNLPNWEDFPPLYQQQLIQALSALLMQQPELQTLLEVAHEPKL